MDEYLAAKTSLAGWKLLGALLLTGKQTNKFSMRQLVERTSLAETTIRDARVELSNQGLLVFSSDGMGTTYQLTLGETGNVWQEEVEALHRGTGSSLLSLDGAEHTATGQSEVPGTATKPVPNEGVESRDSTRSGQANRDLTSIIRGYAELYPTRPKLTPTQAQQLLEAGGGRVDWVLECLGKSKQAKVPYSYALAILRRETPPPLDEEEGVEGLDIMRQVLEENADAIFDKEKVNPLIREAVKKRGRNREGQP